MKNTRKITLVSLLAVFVVAILTAIGFMLMQADVAFAYQAEMKAYQISLQYDIELKRLTHVPTIDEDFNDDEIIIVLDCEHSGTELKNSYYNFDEVVAELGNIDNIDINSIEELFETEDNETVSSTYRRMLSLKLETSGKNNIIEAIEQLNKLDMVLSAEPQYNYSAVDSWMPEDTYYSQQWGLNGAYGINAEAAWDISKGSGVKVGLFERGIDANHEDLEGRVAQGNFTPSNGTDAAHGTHVGGIISAVSNEFGVAGISQATLYLLNRQTFVSSLSSALDNDIKIINASFYYEYSDSPAPADASDRQAIENYGSKGGLLICAAGNDHINSDNSPLYPAGYGDARLFPNVTNVISVGSINGSGNISSISNYGINSVHIYAPGDFICSTLPNNHYGEMSGTSMAAPHVTGVAALLLSKDPTLTATELKDIILNNADDITISTPDGTQNVKKLNAYTALKSYAQEEYNVTLHYGGGLSGSDTVSVAYGETMPLPYGRDSAPIHRGYEFVGYFSGENGSGTQYYSMEVHSGSDSRYYERLVPLRRWYNHSNGDLYGYWKPLECDYTYTNVKLNDGYFDESSTVYLKHGTTATITAKTFEGYKFLYFNRGGVQVSSQTVTWDIELKRSEDDGKVYPVDGFFAVYDKDECIAAGSLITLESLTGNEELLVWNLYTGMYDTAPILFIDSDPSGLYEVIKLYFSDGTQVKVISEHGFWDYNLNEYVYLGVNAYEYIGHWFNKGETKVQLTDVEIMEEYTTPYSPVTYGHLCYFVDGMLSMPGGIDGLFNIFAVDAETMKYDESAMAADIERYGLFTYEEFAELVPVSEEVFNAFNGRYLKVAIGKGLIDTDRLLSLAQRYAEFF